MSASAEAPVRVLFCETNVDRTIGGSYFSLLFLASGLDRRKFTPIVVFSTEHALLPRFVAAGVETIVWPPPRPFSFGRDWRGARRWLRAPASFLRRAINVLWTLVIPTLQRSVFLRRRRVRIVHLNNSVLYNHDWMLAARLSGARCVTHERGINERFPAVARWHAQRLDAIICISEAVRSNLVARGVDFGNLVLIHNGLDPDAVGPVTGIDELRRHYRLPPSAVVVVMLGNLKVWKGQESVVRAIGLLKSRLPTVRCLFVGDYGPADSDFAELLRSLVDNLQLREHVIFTGYQANVAPYIAMSDMVVHASILPEPFGRVILEAMALRRPIVASRAGAIPEIVEHGVSGLTFTPGDSVALAESILRLAQDKAEASAMGQRGYERLMAKFHIRANLVATQGLYERLLRVTD